MASVNAGQRNSVRDALRSVRDSLVSLIVFGAVTAGAAILGSVFTSRSTGEGSWYGQLDKPVFNPPSWLISSVWTVLYAFIALAAWQVWRHGSERRDVQLSTVLFGVQLALNALWSYLFFGMESPRSGLIGIVALLVAIVAWYVSAFRINSRTRLLILPYIAWVGFATVLNGSIWWMNS